MKSLSFLHAFLPILLATIALHGCSINDASMMDTDKESDLMAASVSETSVALRWDRIWRDGALCYLSWRGADPADTGSAGGLQAPEYIVEGLQAATLYTFTVTVTGGGGSDQRASTDWTGAAHYLNDRDDSMKALRLYENGAIYGAGLTIDTLFGGPRNVSADVTKPGLVQLAVEMGDDVVTIGPPYAFSSYRESNNTAKYDSTVFISPTTYAVASLDTWFADRPISGLMGDRFYRGNIVAYSFINSTTTSPQGFYVRTGPPGAYHFARVLVTLGRDGRMLQGAVGNRYVELEISYQKLINTPFAKGTVSSAPVGVHAHPIGR